MIFFGGEWAGSLDLACRSEVVFDSAVAECGEEPFLQESPGPRCFGLVEIKWPSVFVLKTFFAACGCFD